MVKNIGRHFFGEFTPNKGGELLLVWTYLPNHFTGFLDRLLLSIATYGFKVLKRLPEDSKAPHNAILAKCGKVQTFFSTTVKRRSATRNRPAHSESL